MLMCQFDVLLLANVKCCRAQITWIIHMMSAKNILINSSSEKYFQFHRLKFEPNSRNPANLPTDKNMP